MLCVFTDASYTPGADHFGIGAVVIDEAGEEVAVCAAAIACPAWWTSSLAERHAALDALLFASTLGLSFALHTDDRSLAAVLAGPAEHRGASEIAKAHRHYVQRLRAEVAGGVRVRFIPRRENQRANHLSRWALRTDPPQVMRGQLEPVRGEWRQRWPVARTASVA